MAKLRGNEAQYVGCSDPMNAVYQERLGKEFPEAKWVVVRRDIGEVTESARKAFEWQDPKRGVECVREKLGDVLLYRDPLVVEFSGIDYDVAMAVAKHVNPEWACSRERTEMLLTFNVQLESQRLSRLIKAPMIYPDKELEPPAVTATNRAFMDRVYLICDGHREAWEWFMQVMVVAHVWDHCVDGDVVNPIQAMQAFDALVLDWPTNSFLRKNLKILSLAMDEAVARWKDGTMEGAYAVNWIIPKAIAKALDVDWDKHENVIMNLVKQLQAEDKRRDEIWVQQ